MFRAMQWSTITHAAAASEVWHFQTTLIASEIHRNHHRPEDSEGVSSHRLVPILPTFYISHFQMITGFRLRLNWNVLLKCVNNLMVHLLTHCADNEFQPLVNRNVGMLLTKNPSKLEKKHPSVEDWRQTDRASCNATGHAYSRSSFAYYRILTGRTPHGHVKRLVTLGRSC